LDVTAAVRRVAEQSREGGGLQVPLHANKVQEWLAKLEAWAHDAETRVEAELNKQRGARRARELLAAPTAEKPRGKKRN
jgi:hypothetical protein